MKKIYVHPEVDISKEEWNSIYSILPDEAVVHIEPGNDEDPGVTEFENHQVQLYFFHKKYKIGNPSFYEIDEFKEHLRDITKGGVKSFLKNVYMYDHGSQVLDLYPFSDRWDSGQVGWFFCRKDEAVGDTNEEKREWFLEEAKKQIEVYNMWLLGDSYKAILIRINSVPCSCLNLYSVSDIVVGDTILEKETRVGICYGRKTLIPTIQNLVEATEVMVK